MTRFALTPITCLLLVATSVTACQDDTGPGSVVIPVTLGNEKSCTELGIATLFATLGEDDEEQTPCLDASREIRFDGIPAGRYPLYVAGRNDAGVATMDSGATENLSVEVIGDGATVRLESPVRLTDAPAHLWIRWSFDFSSCDNAGIQTFRLTAFEEGGSSYLLDHQVACKVERDPATNYYYPVPDPDRVVKGNLLGEVALQPLDKGGLAIGPAVTFAFPPPGPGHDIRLSLTQCGTTGCMGTGTPDP